MSVRPKTIRAILAVEPSGPPFFDIQAGPAAGSPTPDWSRYSETKARPWGITADPLSYSPPAAKASDLDIAEQEKSDEPNLDRCWMQKAPARQLPRLQRIPILVVTSEASYHALYDHCTVKYLEQAGVRATWIKLAEVGIRGNGHMMMLEKNNMEISAVMSGWLEKALASGTKNGR